MSESEECLEDCRAWGSQILTELSAVKNPGGSAKEKPSRVRGGSGVGAERRSELQFAECLEDSGPGGQILRNVLRIVAPGGATFRGAWRR